MFSIDKPLVDLLSTILVFIAIIIGMTIARQKREYRKSIKHNDSLPSDEKIEFAEKLNTETKEGLQCSISGLYNDGYIPIQEQYKRVLVLDIFKDRLEICEDWQYQLNSCLREVKLENIKDIQYKTEEEIRRDVTLTRLAVLGIFAFGLKKKSIETRYYLIVTTVDDGYDNDLVLQVSSKSNDFVRQFRENKKNINIVDAIKKVSS